MGNKVSSAFKKVGNFFCDLGAKIFNSSNNIFVKIVGGLIVGVGIIFGGWFSQADMDKAKERDKREEAVKLNTLGEEAFNQNHFDTAQKHFHDSIMLTDGNDPNLPKYRSNLERVKAAKLNKEGNILMLQGDYKGAIEKFKLALQVLAPHKSQFGYDEKTYRNNLANAYNTLGNVHFNRQEFEEAKKNYEQAVNARPTDKLGDYQKNVSMVQSAIRNRDAEIFNRQGLEAFERGEYANAVVLFQKALNTADSDYINKYKFQNNHNRAKGHQLNEEGEALFKRGNFREALKKFQGAYDISPSGLKESFKHNLDKSQAEVHNLDGMDFLNRGEHENAIKKFHEALKIIPNTEIKRQVAIKDNLANTHNSFGEKLLNSNNYDASLKQFNLALENASESNSNRQKMIKNRNLARWEVLYAESKKQHKDKNYTEAIERLNEAIETIPEERKSRLRELIEYKAKVVTDFGEYYMEKGAYNDAKLQFEEARELTEDTELKLELTDKIGDAQTKYFENIFKTEMEELDELSDEEAVRNMNEMLNLYEDTVALKISDGMDEKLDKMMEELTERRAFDQVGKAAGIGKTYFLDEQAKYSKIIAIEEKVDENEEYLMSLLDYQNEDDVKHELSVKYFS